MLPWISCHFLHSFISHQHLCVICMHVWCVIEAKLMHVDFESVMTAIRNRNSIYDWLLTSWPVDLNLENSSTMKIIKVDIVVQDVESIDWFIIYWMIAVAIFSYFMLKNNFDYYMLHSRKKLLNCFICGLSHAHCVCKCSWLQTFPVMLHRQFLYSLCCTWPKWSLS